MKTFEEWWKENNGGLCGYAGAMNAWNAAMLARATPPDPQHGREPDKYAHKSNCNPKPWENDCECGALQRAREPDKVKPLAQYLDKYLRYEGYELGSTGLDSRGWDSWRELLEQALDAYESTENVTIKIERV